MKFTIHKQPVTGDDYIKGESFDSPAEALKALENEQPEFDRADIFLVDNKNDTPVAWMRYAGKQYTDGVCNKNSVKCEATFEELLEEEHEKKVQAAEIKEKEEKRRLQQEQPKYTIHKQLMSGDEYEKGESFESPEKALAALKAVDPAFDGAHVLLIDNKKDDAVAWLKWDGKSNEGIHCDTEFEADLSNETMSAQNALAAKFGATKEASKNDLDGGVVVGAVDGMAVLNMGRGVHFTHRIPPGQKLPELGQVLAQQKGGPER